jgi:hypothetical protein
MYGLIGGVLTYRAVEIIAPRAQDWVKWVLAIVAGIAVIAYFYTHVDEKPVSSNVQGSPVSSPGK